MRRSDSRREGKRPMRWSVGIALLSATALLVGGARASDETAGPQPEFETVLLDGRVVWYADALQRRLGIQTVPEAAERVLALETDDGTLIPLVDDLRTRAFRKDPRLREIDVRLRVRRYRATPAVQILTIYERAEDGIYEVDYWCDVCSIPMFEPGPCACCQQDNRLRRQRIEQRPAK
jgi:hypothetical protein